MNDEDAKRRRPIAELAADTEFRGGGVNVHARKKLVKLFVVQRLHIKSPAQSAHMTGCRSGGILPHSPLAAIPRASVSGFA